VGDRVRLPHGLLRVRRGRLEQHVPPAQGTGGGAGRAAAGGSGSAGSAESGSRGRRRGRWVAAPGQQADASAGWEGCVALVGGPKHAQPAAGWRYHKFVEGGR